MNRVPTQRLSPATGTTSTDGCGDEDWRHRAACRDEDPELFFPNGNVGPALLQVEEAKAVCRRCEVMDTCLRWALETRQDTGIWGGLTEDERRRASRRRAKPQRPARTRPQCGTPAGPGLHRRHKDLACQACRDYETTQRRAAFTTKCPGIDALADQGWNLDDTATHYGIATDTIERGLRGTGQYTLLRRLRRNPGRDAAQAA